MKSGLAVEFGSLKKKTVEIDLQMVYQLIWLKSIIGFAWPNGQGLVKEMCDREGVSLIHGVGGYLVFN
jgi:hypothetical protein